MSARSRWLDWQPGRGGSVGFDGSTAEASPIIQQESTQDGAEIMERIPEPEPTKPTKPGSPRGTDATTETTKTTKVSSVPRMPQGVKLVRWEPKPAPVLLTTASVVTDVDQFIRATLAELGKALRSKQGPATHRKVRELVDRLEECGVVVKINGVGSPETTGEL